MDSPEASGRNVEADALFEFWNIYALFLEIWVTTNLAARVELRGTGTVRISSTDD